MLGIPSFYVANSHNIFLDVAIEQGLLGGLSVLIIFVMSIWFMARAIAKNRFAANAYVWLAYIFRIGYRFCSRNGGQLSL
jgi:O-antigen ligase